MVVRTLEQVVCIPLVRCSVFAVVFAACIAGRWAVYRRGHEVNLFEQVGFIVMFFAPVKICVV